MSTATLPPNTPVSELVEAFVVPKRAKGLHPDFVREIKHVGELFVEFAGIDPPGATVSKTMLAEFQDWLAERMSEKTAHRYRGRLAAAVETMLGLPRWSLTKTTGRKGRIRPEPTEGMLRHLYQTSYRKRHRSSATTDFQYRVQFDHFARFLGHEPTLDDLTDVALDGFLEDRAARVAAPTANKAYWCIVALWRHAYDLGMVKTRPTIQPLEEADLIPFAWFKEEIETLLSACSDVQGEIDGIPARLWWLGLHWFIWSTGERVGAVRAVKKADVNLVRGEAFVPAHVRKGRRKPKLYPLLPQAVEILGQFDHIERELLFPWPMDISTLYNRYKRILRAAGLPSDRKCKFHRMRRSFASYIEAAGGNATQALGHSTRRVFERSYGDPRICGGQDFSRLLPTLQEEEIYVCQLVEEVTHA